VNLITSAYKIRLLKRIDATIGVPLARLLFAPTYHSDVQVKSVLIIRPGGIGDALLLAPLIRALRVKYSDASISILAESRNAGAFSLIPSFDRLLIYDNFRNFIQLFLSRYDLIIDTEQWHRLSAVIARLVPSYMKIGFGTNERKSLFTHQVTYSHEDYEGQSFLNLLHPLGMHESFDYSSPFLSIPNLATSEITPLLGSLKSQYISIFPGASITERRWEINKYRELVLRLDHYGISCVIIGGIEDQSSGEAIVSGTFGLNLTGRTSIAGTAAIIHKSRLLVSGDSGILHMGVGLGIPTVSLFGAGIVKKWAPKGENHLVLSRNLSCSPCTIFGTTPDCIYRVRCLEEISVECVYEAVVSLLEN